MEVKKLTAAIGAEIHGVDLAQTLTPDAVREIRQAWLEHCVLFFREQALADAQILAFAQALCVPGEYPFIKGLPVHPCITAVVKLEHERHNFGGIWHSDTAYLGAPPMG